MARQLLFTCLLLPIQQDGWTQDFNSVQIRATPIDQNIFVLQGYGGNIVVSTGIDGTLIVDDEYAPLTEKVITAISELTLSSTGSC